MQPWWAKNIFQNIKIKNHIYPKLLTSSEYSRVFLANTSVSSPPAGSWDCTCRWFWSSASLCEAFSARSLTPSCSRSCRAWTASSNCAWTSSWCGKPENWSWRKSCTQNSSSSIALQRPWSSGLERRIKTERILWRMRPRGQLEALELYCLKLDDSMSL